MRVLRQTAEATSVGRQAATPACRSGPQLHPPERHPTCHAPPAVPCRSKKRASLVNGDAENLPMTRSGQVRRSDTGPVTRRASARFSKQPAAAAGAAASREMEWEQQAQAAGGPGPARRRSGGAARRDSVAGSLSLGGGGSAPSRRASLGAPGGGAALCVVRGRTCVVVDGCLDSDPSSCLSICVRSFTGLEVRVGAEMQQKAAPAACSAAQGSGECAAQACLHGRLFLASLGAWQSFAGLGAAAAHPWLTTNAALLLCSAALVLPDQLHHPGPRL